MLLPPGPQKGCKRLGFPECAQSCRAQAAGPSGHCRSQAGRPSLAPCAASVLSPSPPLSALCSSKQQHKRVARPRVKRKGGEALDHCPDTVLRLSQTLPRCPGPPGRPEGVAASRRGRLGTSLFCNFFGQRQLTGPRTLSSRSVSGNGCVFRFPPSRKRCLLLRGKMNLQDLLRNDDTGEG